MVYHNRSQLLHCTLPTCTSSDNTLGCPTACRREDAAAASTSAGGTVPAAAAAAAAAGDDEELSFEELVDLAQPSYLELDAFSSRGLFHAPPASMHVLSSLRLRPDRFLQRYEVTARSGECMVLTVSMQV